MLKTQRLSAQLYCLANIINSLNLDFGKCDKSRWMNFCLFGELRRQKSIFMGLKNWDGGNFYLKIAIIDTILQFSKKVFLTLVFCTFCTFLKHFKINYQSVLPKKNRRRRCLDFHCVKVKEQNIYCQALSISLSLNLSLSLRDRDRADTIITLPHHTITTNISL